MTRLVDIAGRGRSVADYAAVGNLAPAVHELEALAKQVAPRFRGCTLWMVNSTPQGGGVAEMLPGMVSLLRDLGFSVEWAVIESDEPDFFALTKRLHNLIHGRGDPELSFDDRALYEAVNRENARFLSDRLEDDDILVVHDPQPMPLAGILRESRRIRTIWRCHIGLDFSTPETRAAWSFLGAYAGAYDHAVFSTPEYIPAFFSTRASIVHPAIDPLSHKNRELTLHQTLGVLANARLSRAGPVLTRPFEHPARRARPEDGFVPADEPDEIGLPTRPIVTQISRWDRLKGWIPLLRAFALLKRRMRERPEPATEAEAVRRRRLELLRLVLAGPELGAIQDDPEAQHVLEELVAAYGDLEPAVQRDVALVTLPMGSLRENHLMVNALQRASTVVVQNSLREGFGLTIVEAMWKRVPILSNAQACGPRQQVRDRLDGRLVEDPEDVAALADALEEMLSDYAGRRQWGRSAQRHVYDRFLVLRQLQEWIHLLAAMYGPDGAARSGAVGS